MGLKHVWETSPLQWSFIIECIAYNMLPKWLLPCSCSCSSLPCTFSSSPRPYLPHIEGLPTHDPFPTQPSNNLKWHSIEYTIYHKCFPITVIQWKFDKYPSSPPISVISTRRWQVQALMVLTVGQQGVAPIANHNALTNNVKLPTPTIKKLKQQLHTTAIEFHFAILLNKRNL